MKKLIALLLALAMVLALVACGGNSGNAGSNGSTSEKIETEEVDHDAELTLDNTETTMTQDETAELADCKVMFCLAVFDGFLNTFKLDKHRAPEAVYVCHYTDVTIEDAFVVVISQLHHTVAAPELHLIRFDTFVL